MRRSPTVYPIRWLGVLATIVFAATDLSGCAPGSKTPATPATGADTESVADLFTPEPRYRLLTLADFEHFPADATATWAEKNGLIICSGQPKGYIYTREEFRNFTLRCEFRYVPPTPPPDAAASDKFNTGFMIYIQEPQKVWPASLEVQGRFDEIGSIKSNGGVPALKVQDDPQGRVGVRLPIGKWNAVEIVSRSGALTSTLNGMPICISQPGDLKSGRLGLQSEGFEVQFKHLRVKIDE